MPIDPATVGMAVNAAISTGQALGIGNKGRDKRQIKQQQKLTDMQVKAQKDLGAHQNAMQMDMWNKTNYGAQVEHLNKAGLNPALLYGGGGGGGATVGANMATGVSGGDAANSAQTKGADTQSMQIAGQLAMMNKQMELLDAQTRKTNAEADKTAGTDTAESQERTVSLKFQNELNKAIGIDDMRDRYAWANRKLDLEATKALAEYETWVAANYAGKATDDPTSPAAKAMRAGLEKTVEDLKTAKLNNDAQAATNVVKQFEARLAEQGIHPHSPWWTKLLTDVLGKVGLTDLIGIGEQRVKSVIK